MHPSVMVIRKFSSTEQEEEDEVSPSFTANTSTQWDKYFEELKKFQRHYGHLRVSADYSTRQLYSFISKQRTLYQKVLEGKKTSLTHDRIKHLNDIGFIWCPLEDRWNERYNQLKEFYEKEGTSNLTLIKKASPQLVKWVSRQRHLYKRVPMNKPTTMTEERRNKLNAIGFLWNVNDSDWMEMFEELRSVLQNGNLTTFDVAATNGYLRSWILYQRHQLKAFLAGKPSSLKSDKVEKLKSINFTLENPTWLKKFALWVECRSKHGKSSSKYPKKIINWIMVQRREYIKLKEGKPTTMDETKLNLLLQAGFEFNVKFCFWSKRFEEWKVVRDRLLISRPKESKALNSWIHRQAQLFLSYEEGKSTLPSSSLKKIKLLQSERFYEEYLKIYPPPQKKKGILKSNLVRNKRKVKVTLDNSAPPSLKHVPPKWSKMFMALQEYKKQNGDCFISPTSTQHLPLRLWVEEQSLNYSNGSLSKEQVDELEKLGLNIEAILEGWNSMHNQMYSFYLNHGHMHNQMYSFYLNHGHCVIPSNDASLRPLFDWAQRQREIRNLLSKAQHDSLCNYGFSWDENEAVWKEMIHALRRFRSENGHCAVPQIYLPYPSLAVWVMQMRQEYKLLRKGESTNLNERKIEDLEKEGFVWDECSWKWELRYKELLEFSSTNGHCSVPLWYPLNPQLGHWVVMQQRQLDLMRRGFPHKLTDESVALLEKIGL